MLAIMAVYTVFCLSIIFPPLLIVSIPMVTISAMRIYGQYQMRREIRREITESMRRTERTRRNREIIAAWRV